MLDPSRLPEPYEFAIGQRVYHPDRGYGWLGYPEADPVLFYLPDGGEVFVPQFEEIKAFDDQWTSRTWLLLCNGKEVEAFMLCPDEGLENQVIHPHLAQFLGR